MMWASTEQFLRLDTHTFFYPYTSPLTCSRIHNFTHELRILTGVSIRSHNFSHARGYIADTFK
jgi:hypothetical protein